MLDVAILCSLLAKAAAALGRHPLLFDGPWHPTQAQTSGILQAFPSGKKTAALLDVWELGFNSPCVKTSWNHLAHASGQYKPLIHTKLLGGTCACAVQ